MRRLPARQAEIQGFGSPGERLRPSLPGPILRNPYHPGSLSGGLPASAATKLEQEIFKRLETNTSMQGVLLEMVKLGAVYLSQTR